MLRITPSAKSELREMLGRLAPDGSEHCNLGFRLVSTEQGNASLGLTLDLPRPRDELYLHEERNALLLDCTVSERLDGLTLDVTETEGGKRFTLR